MAIGIDPSQFIDDEEESVISANQFVDDSESQFFSPNDFVDEGAEVNPIEQSLEAPTEESRSWWQDMLGGDVKETPIESLQKDQSELSFWEKMGQSAAVLSQSGGGSGMPAIADPHTAKKVAVEVGTIAAVDAAFAPIVAAAGTSGGGLIASALIEGAARLAQAGYAGAATAITDEIAESGEVPDLEKVKQQALEWGAVDAAMQVMGLGGRFGSAISNIAKESGQSKTNVLKQLFKAGRNWIKGEGKVPKNPSDINPKQAEKLVDLSEQLEGRIKVKDPAEVIDITDSVREIVQSDKVQVKPAKMESKAPKVPKTTKKPVEPEKPKDLSERVKQASNMSRLLPGEAKSTQAFERRFVPIPKEFEGKSSDDIMGEYVQTYKPTKSVSDGRSWKKKAEIALYDDTRLLDELVGDGTPFLEDPRVKIEEYRSINSRIENVLKESTYDMETGLANGPGFAKIFKQKKFDRVSFDKYLAAESSLDRQGLGQVNPVPTASALDYIKQNKKKFDAVAKELRAFSNRGLEGLQQAGFMSKEGLASAKAKYPRYAPLNRVMPESEFEAQMSGKTSIAKVPKKAKGSERMVSSPTENIVKNTIMWERAKAKNEIHKSIGKLLKKQGVKVVREGPKMFSKDELQARIGDQYRITDENYDWFNLAANVSGEGMFDPKAQTLSWYENGNRMTARATPDVVRMLNNLSPMQLGSLGKWANKIKTAISMGVVLPIDQTLKFTGMTTVLASIQTKHKAGLMTLPKFAMNVAKSFFDVIGRSEMYQDFKMSGAASHTLGGVSRGELEASVDTLTNAIGKKDPWALRTVKAPLKIAKFAIETLGKVSSALDESILLAEYSQSIKKYQAEGMSKREAMARASRDADLLDYSRSKVGDLAALREMYNYVPFIKTIMNSGVRQAQVLNPKNPGSGNAWLTALGALAVPAIIFYLKNRDEEWYQNKTIEERSRYIWINEDYKIPKVWGYGWLFQTLPEALAEYALQKDPELIEDLFRSFEYEFSPLTFMSLSNAFHNGRFEPARIWEGSRINRSSKYLKKPPELQYGPNTTEVSKKIGEWFNIPPDSIDMGVQRVTANLGRQVMRGADEMLYSLGVFEDNRPEQLNRNAILFGWLHDKGPKTFNNWSQKYYEQVDEMEAKRLKAEELNNQGKHVEADKVLDYYVPMGSYRSQLSPFYKALDKIKYEKADTPEKKKKKRQEIDQVITDMTKKMRDIVEAVEENKADLRKKRK